MSGNMGGNAEDIAFRPMCNAFLGEYTGAEGFFVYAGSEERRVLARKLFP